MGNEDVRSKGRMGKVKLARELWQGVRSERFAKGWVDFSANKSFLTLRFKT